MDSTVGIAWQIDFLDVGQGDATIIRLPSDEYILIDTGPSPRNVNPLIQWFALPPRKMIRTVVITHNDWDHVGGLLGLAANPTQDIQSVLFVRDKTSAFLPDNFKSIIDLLKGREDAGRTRTNTLEKGVTIYQDAILRLAVRHPSMVQTMGIQPNNAVSAVITLERLSDNAVLVIWGGDATLKTIASHCGPTTTDILFGPHHGCPQDTPKKTHAFIGFLNQINPRCIFISVGRGKNYGHPHREYVKGAVGMGATVCCSEVTQQCVDAERITSSVFQGSGRYGYTVPPYSKQCRGTMRITTDNGGTHYDADQAEFIQRIKKFQHTLCSTYSACAVEKII